MTALFLSDLHLRDGTGVKTQLVVRFFQEVAACFDRLYILGDLFDSWPGTTQHLIRAYAPILNILKELSLKGHEVHYIEGNHDFRLGEFFAKEIGVIVHPLQHEEVFSGRKILMLHGDTVNEEERATHLLRKFLRNDFLHGLLKVVPSRWIHQLGLRTSGLRRAYQGCQPMKEEKIRATYRNSAQRFFSQGYDMVLMGHTHLPDDLSVTLGDRTCRYINLGDWVRHFTYVEFREGHFYTKVHSVTQNI